MAFRVELTQRADKDAQAIYRHIIQEAPVAGQAWYVGLFAAIDSLAENPRRCLVVRFDPVEARVVRQLLYGKKPHVYRVYYRICGEVVEIMHIRHGARALPRRW